MDAGVVGDVQQLETLVPVQQRNFDLAYSRWLLCFVPDPEGVVAGVASMLKSGGRFAIHDYFNYESMTVAPRRASYTRMVQASAASWRSQGGDPDIARRLTKILQRHGFVVDQLIIHQRVARPGESMFQRVFTWWNIYGPKLVTMGFLSENKCKLGLAELNELAQSSSDFVFLQPVAEILAIKR